MCVTFVWLKKDKVISSRANLAYLLEEIVLLRSKSTIMTVQYDDSLKVDDCMYFGLDGLERAKDAEVKGGLPTAQLLKVCMIGDKLARIHVRILPCMGDLDVESTLVVFTKRWCEASQEDKVVSYGRMNWEGTGFRYVPNECWCLDVQLLEYGYHEVRGVVMHPCWASKGGPMVPYDVFSDVGPGQARPPEVLANLMGEYQRVSYIMMEHYIIFIWSQINMFMFII